MVHTVNPALFRVPLRLVSVALEDRRTYAVDERGGLFRSPDPTKWEPMVEIGRVVPIVDYIDPSRLHGADDRLKTWLENGFGDRSVLTLWRM